MLALAPEPEVEAVTAPGRPRFAVLAPGPSLTQTWRRALAPRYETVIGVNRAAEMFPVDWLSAGDWQAVSMFPVKFSAGWVSQDDCIRLARHGEVIPINPFPDRWRSVGWSALGMTPTYSGPAALLLTRILAAGRPANVDVYGMDMAGTVGSDGDDPVGRQPARWATERAIVQAVCAFLLDDGVRVRFVRG